MYKDVGSSLVDRQSLSSSGRDGTIWGCNGSVVVEGKANLLQMGLEPAGVLVSWLWDLCGHEHEERGLWGGESFTLSRMVLKAGISHVTWTVVELYCIWLSAPMAGFSPVWFFNIRSHLYSMFLHFCLGLYSFYTIMNSVRVANSFFLFIETLINRILNMNRIIIY